METLLKSIVEQWSITATFVIAAIIVWIVAKLYFKRFVPMETKIKDAPCDKHDRLLENMGTIMDSIRKIEDYIIKKDTSSIDVLLRKCSPYRLTSAGDALLDVSGGKKCVDENVDFFDVEIQKLSPQVALDVETYSLSELAMVSNIMSSLTALH